MKHFWKKVIFPIAAGLTVATSNLTAAPPPGPSVTLTAAPTTIFAGQSTQLSWKSQQAESVTIEPGIGRVSPDGTLTVFPTQNTTYIIKATTSKKTASASASVTVTPLQPGTVKAEFSSAVQKGLSPLTIYFKDRSVASSGNSIVSWAWDFDGDGTIDSNIRNPSFNYMSPGLYTVALTVSDDSGNSDTVIETDYILADTDTDGDTILDTDDNCPGIYNLTQVDLDRDGIGTACDEDIDLLHAAAHILQIRKDTSDEVNPLNVTGLLKDGLIEDGLMIGKEKKSDVLAFYSAVDASELSAAWLGIFLSLPPGQASASARIYAYNSDGVSVQSSVFAAATLTPGWNDVDVTGLLSAMDGFGFVKFRLAAAETGLTVTEAQLTGTSAKGLDYRIISAIPGSVDFGVVVAGKYVYQKVEIVNTGEDTLDIEPIMGIAAPFAIVSEDCSGAQIVGPGQVYGRKSCTLLIGASTDSEGVYKSSLSIISNDMDSRVLKVPLSLTVTASAVLSGVLTDADTGLPVGNSPVSISLSRPLTDIGAAEFIYSSFARDGKETIWNTSDYGLISENDERKISFEYGRRHRVAFRYPYEHLDELQVAWNGIGGDTREYVLAQSFIAGASGPLTKVSLRLKKESLRDSFKGTVTAFLKSSYGGEKAAILATSSRVDLNALIDDQYNWVDVPFPAPYSVTSGARYYIEIATPATIYGGTTLSYTLWAVAPSNSYRHGRGYSRVNGNWSETLESFEFKTFVSDLLDQHPASQCDVCKGYTSQGFLTCDVILSLSSRDSSISRLVARRSHEPGYDDLTLSGAVKEDAEKYLADNGWMHLSISARNTYLEYGSETLSTDQVIIKPFVKYSAITNADGGFIIQGLPVADGDVLVSVPGYYPYSASLVFTSGGQTILPAALSKAPPVEIAIEQPIEGQIINQSFFSVRGTLSEPAQVSVNGVKATIWGDAGTSFWANLDLVDGENIITATAVGQHGQISTRSVTIRVITTGILKGSVRCYPGPTPAAAATVTLTDARGIQKTTSTSATGAYEIGEVASGNFTLSAVKDGYNPQTVVNSINSGQIKVLDLYLYPPPAISFTTLPEAIAAGESANLRWSTQNCNDAELQPGFGKVACSGSAVVSPVQTTTYTLTATGMGGSAMAQATLAVTPPPPTLIFEADAAEVVRGEIVRLTWSTTDATTCFIEPEIGSVPVNGFIDVTPESTKTYILTASGPGGIVTGNVTITVTASSPITLQITEPSSGSDIARPDVMVRGTFSNLDGSETGIIVNGIAALIDGNHFIANHVPLQAGENRITATATDMQGHASSTSITVTAEPEAEYIRITAIPDRGISPLNATLRMEGSFSIPDSSISYSGPGAVEFMESGATEEYAIRMTVPGIYLLTSEVQNEDEVYTDSVAVQVLDENQLDARLKTVYNGVKAGLEDGDVEKAAAFFTFRDRDRYRDVFYSLSDKLQRIAADMQGIEPVYVRADVAKYRTYRLHEINGELVSITYYIYFRIDTDGIWRMVQF